MLRALIRAYQLASRVSAPRCRFYPSCSEFAREALAAKGLARGLGLSVRRLLRCHPWNPGGWDPVS
jgi:putative membrane protein insertion efficiency factor